MMSLFLLVSAADQFRGSWLILYICYFWFLQITFYSVSIFYRSLLFHIFHFGFDNKVTGHKQFIHLDSRHLINDTH